MYCPFETQVTPLTYVRRKQVLPAPGHVLVNVDEQVEPMQVIARTDLPGDLYVLPVARLLDVTPSNIGRYLRVKRGDEVKQGQVVAARRGLRPRSIKSPVDGVVKSDKGRRMLIETQPTRFELRAYVYGTVSKVLERHGVVIETIGALIQAAWGTGGKNFGVLKCLAKNPNEPLQAKEIDPSCLGMILVGGAGLSDKAIEQAEALNIRGIVTGGLQPELIPQVEKLPFPVIATEGIGTTPMSTPIFRLLSTNDGREAMISGQFQPRWGIVRPEIIIPVPAGAKPPSQMQPGAPLRVGIRVRVVRAPYMGAVGTVLALPTQARRIETGARVRGAEVDLGKEKPIFVPLANLEILP
jgi:hypothetical protein